MGRRASWLFAVVLGGVSCGVDEPEDLTGVSAVRSPLSGLCAGEFSFVPLGPSEDAGIKLVASSRCASNVPGRHTFRARHIATGQSVTVCSNQLSEYCLWASKGLASGWWEVELEIARDGSAGPDARVTQNYRLGARCRSTTLAVSPATPSLGQSVTVQAQSVCDDGVVPEFRFTAQQPAGPVVLAEWGAASSATWTVGQIAGRHSVQVEVRQKGSSLADAGDSKKFALGSFCELGSTQLQGSEPSFAATATSTCFNGAFALYRFWQRSPSGQQALLRDWGSAQLPWTTTGLKGTWRLVTDMAINPNAKTQTSQVSKALQDACTVVTLSGVPTAQMKGIPYVMSASASCPLPEFRFTVKPEFGASQTVCDWSPSGSCTWSTSNAVPGHHSLVVETRRQGSPEIPSEGTSLVWTLVDADQDGDGVRISQGDCHDQNAQIKPGAAEVCDGYDNNCTGEIDEGLKKKVGPDADADLHGSVQESVQEQSCVTPPGYSDQVDDCDDTNSAIHPGAQEVCGNAVDENCDTLAPSCVCGQLGQSCCANDACLQPGTECTGANGTPRTCTLCGGVNQPCCANNTCSEAGTVCSVSPYTTPTCRSCGGSYQPCCSGNQCDPSQTCDFNVPPGASPVCKDCGGSGQPCCANNTCAGGAICQQLGLTSSICCGAPGQPCCANNTCAQAGTSCQANSYGQSSCMACGGTGQPCCANNTCAQPGESCIAGPAGMVCSGCGELSQPCCGGYACAQPGTACLTNPYWGMACTSCGGTGQPCCTGNTCAQPGETCQNSPSGMICQAACGSVGQPCCFGAQCSQPGATCQGSTCQIACGGQGQPCCANNTCVQAGTSCQTNPYGQSTCTVCGGMGQPCCGGVTCSAPGSTCLPSPYGGMTCQAGCGGPGQPCCLGGSCSSGFTCQPGPSGVPTCLNLYGGCGLPGMPCCPYPQIPCQGGFCNGSFCY